MPISKAFHHSLTVNTHMCKGCTHCMKVCPTHAIRIVNGKALVDPKRCIDCGQCLDVCPHKAIGIEQEDFNQIFSYTHRVVIIPTTLIGQFDDDVSEQSIIEALYTIGFTEVYYGEFGVDILSALGNNKSAYADKKPIISSYCPAIVRLIQLSYPSLLPHVNLLRTPAQITALYARLVLEQKGIKSEDIGIFYVSGCAAKVAQILTPLSDTSGLIQGGLNMDVICNTLQDVLTKESVQNKERIVYNPIPLVTQGAFLWSLIKGESEGMTARTLAVDEIHNVIEFLELVEDDRHTEIDFLELRSCATGCTGGVLTPRNRFLASERIKHQALTHPTSLPSDVVKEIASLAPYLIRDLKVDRLEAKHSMKLDVDISKALSKLEKAHAIEKVLPGIDCGLCGYPSCKILSEEIAMGNASIRSCAVLKLRQPQTLSRIEKIWGEAIANGNSKD
ncbi:MAG: 4Fe-4S dicluster domain-containing protein [Spirochaetia bacterium]|nr:4Fe-4S dicluster domain-containing protein [Spirochaetia bacterium]